MSKCLYCYRDTAVDEFHPACAKKIFATATIPELPYSLDTMEELAKEIVVQSISVTGVQPKLSLHLSNKSKKQDSRFTLVGLWGNYILKPPTKKYPFMPEVEDLTMHLAELFKIPVVPHSLIRLKSGELAYLTRRIDRNQKDMQPIHMEDFCQLSGKLTEHKYRGSMEGIGKIISKHSSNAMFDMLHFYEIALFSFLTGNGDMHLKNFSLIHSENGLTSLTPAYDLLSTRIFIDEKDDPEEMALTLNGKKRKYKLVDFIEFGNSIGLSEKQILNSHSKFAKNLKSIETLIRLSFAPSHIQDKYLEIIKERLNRLGLI